MCDLINLTIAAPSDVLTASSDPSGDTSSAAPGASPSRFHRCNVSMPLARSICEMDIQKQASVRPAVWRPVFFWIIPHRSKEMSD
jgi:hypothetical protein